VESGEFVFAGKDWDDGFHDQVGREGEIKAEFVRDASDIYSELVVIAGIPGEGVDGEFDFVSGKAGEFFVIAGDFEAVIDNAG